MNVMTIFGGPRKKGNTATVLGWVENELGAQGHRITRVNLSSKKVNGCIGCMKCKDNPKEPGCVLKDDGREIIDEMVRQDAVIYASPLYYWGFTAQMKAFIDRCHCLYRGTCGSSGHFSFVEGQRQALIITAADPFENNAEQVLTTFQRILVYDKAVSAGELLICNCTEPQDLTEDVQVQAGMFAKQLFSQAKAPYSLMIPGGAPNMIPGVS